VEYCSITLWLANWPAAFQVGGLELHWPGIPGPLALAIVATLGYLFGLRNRTLAAVRDQSRREARRAQLVARDLERVARGVRKALVKHQVSLNRFKERVGRWSDNEDATALRNLCSEAEAMIRPTLRIAGQLAEAYDQFRHQTAHLMTFTELRTDPLTGACNRRAMDEAIANQLALAGRYGSKFAVVLLDIDHFKRVNDEQGHLQGDRILQKAASAIDETVRETDILARYGGDEFLAILPQTDLAGGGVLAGRIRARIEERLPLTASVGVAACRPGDSAETLLARADAALYQAKSAGRNRVFCHDGVAIDPVVEQPEATVVSDNPVALGAGD
jgi:diguanylate cyclase